MGTYETAVLVTGAGSGIGEATARLLAARGVAVTLTGRSLEPVARVSAEIEAAGGRALAVRADTSVPEDMVEAVRQALDAFGRLDGAVNNAGVAGTPLPLHEVTPEQWGQVVGVDLSGVFYAMRAELPPMVAASRGAIVNVSSVFADRGLTVDYSAAKHGIRGLTRSAAQQYGPLGIRVNELQPGVVWSDMTRAEPSGTQSVADRGIPLGRIGEPEEVAAAIAFLLSDDARYVTAAHLAVDGGFLA